MEPLATLISKRGVPQMAEVIDILSLVPHSLNLRSNHLWLDYDDEADVLYISRRKPQRATDSETTGSFIYHYDGNQLVGVSVLHAKSSVGSDATS